MPEPVAPDGVPGVVRGELLAGHELGLRDDADRAHAAAPPTTLGAVSGIERTALGPPRGPVGDHGEGPGGCPRGLVAVGLSEVEVPPVVTDVREHVHPCGPCPGRFGFGMFTFGRSSSVGTSDVVASSVVGGQLGRCRRMGFGCGEERRSAGCGVRNDLELAGGGSTEQPL